MRNSRVSAKAVRAIALAPFALSVFMLTAAAPRADFQAGVRAYEAGEYQIALEEWRRLAAEEEPRSLFNLGQMYRLGVGVQKDLAMAEQYYQRAAQQGHVAAHANLGSIYFSQDPPKEFVALYHWRIAARGGDPRAQYLLGVNYFNGDYLPLDYKQAYAWVSMAADAGLKDAEEAKQFIKGYLSQDDLLAAANMRAELLDESATETQLAAAEPPPAEPSPAAPVQEDSDELAFRTPEPDPEPGPAPSPEAETLSDPGPDPEPQMQAAVPSEGESGEEDGFISRPVYKVQLASLRYRAAAEDLIGRLQRRHGGVLAGAGLEVEEADLGAERGTFYRVKTTALPSAEAANEMCESFKARNMGCLTVRSIDVAAFVAPRVATIDTREPDTSPAAAAGDEELSATASLEQAEESPGRIEPGAQGPHPSAERDTSAAPDPTRDSTAGQSGGEEPPQIEDPAPMNQLEPAVAQEADSEEAGTLPLASDVEDRFRVQLASRRDAEDARAEWRLIRGNHPDILRGYAPKLEQADLGDKGVFHRLQVSPFATFGEAEALCGRLRSAGQDCFVTRTP